MVIPGHNPNRSLPLMSYQKKRTNPTTLKKGARGCNHNANPETRMQKLFRKEVRREEFWLKNHDNLNRIEAIMAGTCWVRGKKVDTHQYLPHQSDREIARRTR